jgi:hypothetical protein
LQAFLAIRRDLHLISEAHVVVDVLTGHADIVADLIGAVTSRRATLPWAAA